MVSFPHQAIFPSFGFAAWHFIASETNKSMSSAVPMWVSTSPRRRRPSSRRMHCSSWPRLWVYRFRLILVGKHEVKSVINGTEQCRASRTEVQGVHRTARFEAGHRPAMSAQMSVRNLACFGSGCAISHLACRGFESDLATLGANARRE